MHQFFCLGFAVRRQDLFQPVARLFRTLDETASLKQATFVQEQSVPEVPAVPDASADAATADGDVTEALAPKFSQREKSELVQKLNADAEKSRKQHMRQLVQRQAAGIIRNRVVAFPNTDAVKNYMETTQRGLVARTIVVDVTMPASRQTGAKSRQLCLAPTAADQKMWAAQIKTIPATPVVGHVLIRPASHSIEVFHEQMLATHSHRRTITVPLPVSMSNNSPTKR
jgi:DNA-binding transcriptional regulator PaaX